MANLISTRQALLQAPVVLAVGYFTASALLFFFGPIDWPQVNKVQLAGFLVFAFAAIFIGWIVGSRLKTRDSINLSGLWVMAAAGALANIILLFPAAYVYTGSMPWDFFRALGDQSAAYEQMQRVLAEGMPFRGAVAGLRALAGPATVVLPALSILLWGRMGSRLRMLVVAGLLATFFFSVYRGTDKETFDIAILQGASLAVVLARYVSKTRSVSYFRIAGALTILVLIVGMLLNSLIDKKAQRLGFNADATVEQALRADRNGRPEGLQTKVPVTAFCIGGYICTETVNAGASAREVQSSFAVSMVTAYVAQGYYGLGLALQQPFQSMFGFGHSGILTRLYMAVSHDDEFLDRAITTRLGERGWDARYQWSTAYTWLANDIGVWGAGILVGLIACIWGLSWKDAIYGRNDAAAIVFCLLSWFFVYLPASNQIMQTADGYLALLVWLGLWLLSRLGVKFRRRRLVAAA